MTSSGSDIARAVQYGEYSLGKRAEMPVMRRLILGGDRHISDSQILSIGSLHNMLRALRERAGYQDPLKATISAECMAVCWTVNSLW